MNPRIKTHEEKLQEHVDKFIYEVGAMAEYINTNIQMQQASILENPEFTPQEIFGLLGADTVKVITMTRGLKAVLETYDAVKYPNVPVDLSEIINE